MTEKPMTEQEAERERDKQRRRKILKATMAGGVIITPNIKPGEWVKPIIDSVIVPAHAATSVTTTPAATTPFPPTTTQFPPINSNVNVTTSFSFTFPDVS